VAVAVVLLLLCWAGCDVAFVLCCCAMSSSCGCYVAVMLCCRALLMWLLCCCCRAGLAARSTAGRLGVQANKPASAGWLPAPLLQLEGPPWPPRLPDLIPQRPLPNAGLWREHFLAGG
jgi:hypothetical protein